MKHYICGHIFAPSLQYFNKTQDHFRSPYTTRQPWLVDRVNQGQPVIVVRIHRLSAAQKVVDQAAGCLDKPRLFYAGSAKLSICLWEDRTEGRYLLDSRHVENISVEPYSRNVEQIPLRRHSSKSHFQQRFENARNIYLPYRNIVACKNILYSVLFSVLTSYYVNILFYVEFEVF